MLTGLFLLVLTFGLAAASWRNPGVRVVDVAQLRTLLAAAGASLALLTGALALMRWRIAGDARALWVGLALVFLGAVTVGLGQLVPAVQPRGVDVTVLAWLRPASRIVVMALLVQALASKAVDARLRPWPVLAIAVAITAVFTVLMQAFPMTGAVLAGMGDDVGDHAVALPTVAAVWTALGAFYGYRGVRQQSWLFAYLGLMLLGFALAEVFRLDLYPPDSLWRANAAILRGAAVLVGAIGITMELSRAYVDQDTRLLDSELAVLTNAARVRAEHEADEVRVHEARNALAAIEGATKTLEHYREQLDPETAALLSEAVEHEIERLQQLVTDDTGEAERITVATALRRVLVAARTAGVRLEAHIPADLEALGRGADFVHVVQSLLDRLAHTADAPVKVRGRTDGDRTVLSIASAAVKPSGTSDLGTYVLARLMREQGGGLSVAAGGYELWLPSALAVGEQAMDDTDDVVEVAQGDVLLAPAGHHDADALGLGAVGQEDNGVGTDAQGLR